MTQVRVLKPGGDQIEARTLKEYLDQRGISIGQVARGCRCHRTQISRLVSGQRKAAIPTLQRVAAYLGLSMDRLLAMIDAKQLERAS